VSGYWRLPGRNAEEFTADGWFRTGDVGVFDADGYLELVGRSKDLIITGGYNVYPKEIELLLDARDDVAESAVVGVPHPDFGEAVVAVLTLGEGAAIDESSLREELKTRLAGYKVPKAVRVVEELPRNSMGKVRKNVLRDLFADLFVDREEVRKASRD
jgi:malonyl-CoA/methylmalonyl-CoA synthetase